jgi:hypothetical protein
MGSIASLGKVAAVWLAAVVVAFCAATALLVYLDANPSTKDLDADIAAMQTEIVAAQGEAAKYDGGLVWAMADLRLQVLKTTEAMLQQKRSSFLRRIDLKYTVPSSAPASANKSELDKMAREIADAQVKLEADEKEAARYSGGLVQGLALATVATDHLAIAQLNLAYYGSKYGFVLPPIRPSPAGSPAEKKEEKPGVPVKDKDAF